MQPCDEKLCLADVAPQQHGLTSQCPVASGVPARGLAFNAGQFGGHVCDLGT